MTQKTRETLTELAEQYEGHAESSPLTGGARPRLLAVAAALRDVLSPRTCARCWHFLQLGGEHGICRNGERPILDNYMRANDGCLLGWQAREGDGGKR